MEERADRWRERASPFKESDPTNRLNREQVMTEPRVIASFSDYAGLATAVRMRAAELNVAVAGFPSADRPRRFSMLRLMPLLWMLGAKLQLVEDPDTAHYTERLTKRKTPCLRSGTVHIKISRDFLRSIGRRGGISTMQNRSPAQRKSLARRAARARMAGLSPAERRALARKAAAARWSRAAHGL
jgi:hypothetical protein